MEDGDAVLFLFEEEAVAFEAVDEEGLLRSCGGELQMAAVFAGGLGGQGGHEGPFALVFGTKGELLLQRADLLLGALGRACLVR